MEIPKRNEFRINDDMASLDINDYAFPQYREFVEHLHNKCKVIEDKAMYELCEINGIQFKLVYSGFIGIMLNTDMLDVFLEGVA